MLTNQTEENIISKSGVALNNSQSEKWTTGELNHGSFEKKSPKPIDSPASEIVDLLKEISSHEPAQTSKDKATTKQHLNGDSPNQHSSRQEIALLREINAVRSEHGLDPLKNSRSLQNIAKDNNGIINQTGVIKHHTDFGKLGADSEIIAADGGGMDAKTAVQQWMSSPSHRAILLSPDQNEVGVSIDGNFATADFV